MIGPSAIDSSIQGLWDYIRRIRPRLMAVGYLLRQQKVSKNSHFTCKES
jgi:hypothetical protein